MRRRLALLVAATMALVLVAFVVPLAMLLRTVAADRAVIKATAEVQSLTALVATADPDTLQLSVDQLNATSRHRVTVFLPDGTTVGQPVGRSAGVELAAHGESVTAVAPGGREILVAVQGLPNNGTAVVRTFVSDAELAQGVPQAWTILALLGLLLLALGVVVADRLVRSVVRPIGELAGVSHRLAGGDLEARASAAGPPEVREVATALNHLAGRIRDLIWQEREAVADLSHRLRTPLTALRLEVEAVPAADPEGRIGGQVRALEHAVTALIEDARTRGGGPGSCDAAAVVTERVGFWSVLAEDQQRAIQLYGVPGPLPVGTGPAELAACVDALLGNVFAHTPESTPFAVHLMRRIGGGAYVVVEDGGPGFPVEDPLRRGVSGGGSTGLGLDIARQTAYASGGSLTVDRAATGARVVVELGPPATDRARRV